VTTNAFASWIKENGLTRDAVARALGLGGSAISKYCKPGHWPTLEVAQRIYRFTGGQISPNDMFDWPEGVPQSSAEHERARLAIEEARRKRKEKGNGKAKKRKPRIAAGREQRPE
jgi:transcriptional regulator with XRE-family HTH domain